MKGKGESENDPFHVLVSGPPTASFLGHTFESGEGKEPHGKRQVGGGCVPHSLSRGLWAVWFWMLRGSNIAEWDS